MKQWLRQFLGIEELIQRNDYLRGEISSLSNNIKDMRHNVSVQNRAFGRIIAKLDPNYGVSEFDTARKAESDRIGDEVIKKLKGEVAASNKLTGDYE